MIRTVGKIREGDDVFIIFDAGVAPVHADLVTEIAEEHGIVRLSFAAITQDGDGVAKADIVARIRLREEVAIEVMRGIVKLTEGRK